jgi:hypothetical protein
MVTLTLDELQVNAIRAALDDRVRSLSRTFADLKEQRDSMSNRFALECTEMAIRHATLAQLTIDTALPDPEYPGDMTTALIGAEPEPNIRYRESESELREAWGK